MRASSKTARALAVAFLAFCCDATTNAENKTALLPELPAVLKTIQPSPRSHEHAKGAELILKSGVLGIRLNTATPLTPEQWDAVAALHPRSFSFNDRALRDEDMDRLVALDPLEVGLRITPLTGRGAAKFAEMRHLTKLESHHLLTPTPEAKALATHPTLETFRTAGDFCVEALRAPNLKSVELAQNAANAARVEELATHSKVETLSLFAHNVVTVDDACLVSVVKIKTLKRLRLSFVALTFDGSLKPLLELPNLAELSLYMVDVSAADLAKFKAAAPHMVVKFNRPMTPEYRKTWDEMVAKSAQGTPAK